MFQEQKIKTDEEKLLLNKIREGVLLFILGIAVVATTGCIRQVENQSVSPDPKITPTLHILLSSTPQTTFTATLLPSPTLTLIPPTITMTPTPDLAEFSLSPINYAEEINNLLQLARVDTFYQGDNVDNRVYQARPRGDSYKDNIKLSDTVCSLLRSGEQVNKIPDLRELHVPIVLLDNNNISHSVCGKNPGFMYLTKTWVDALQQQGIGIAIEYDWNNIPDVGSMVIIGRAGFWSQVGPNSTPTQPFPWTSVFDKIKNGKQITLANVIKVFLFKGDFASVSKNLGWGVSWNIESLSPVIIDLRSFE